MELKKRQILLNLVLVIGFTVVIWAFVRKPRFVNEEGVDMEISYLQNNPPKCILSFVCEVHSALREELLKEYGLYTTVFGLKCSCGNRRLGVEGKQINQSGLPLAGAIIILCKSCDKRSVIFDPARHGGDGELGYGHTDEELPAKGARCEYCSGDKFELAAGFQYSGDEQKMIEEDKLDKKPEDLFGWFVLRGRCGSCGRDFEIASIECQ